MKEVYPIDKESKKKLGEELLEGNEILYKDAIMHSVYVIGYTKEKLNLLEALRKGVKLETLYNLILNELEEANDVIKIARDDYLKEKERIKKEYF